MIGARTTFIRVFKNIELIEICVYNVTRIEAQKSCITRNHALGISAWRHRGKIAVLKKLDDLRTDLNRIGNLLNGETQRTATFAKHPSKSTRH